MDTTLAFADAMDAADALRSYRSQFYFPERNGEPLLYLCGNSLGLQPIGTAARVDDFLYSWKTYAVDGYSRGNRPWMTYHEQFKKPLTKIVGCHATEVSVANSLTVNLHLLLCSFYRPTPERYKILIEAGAFPSDQYAAGTQITYHGLDPASALIEVAPREGEYHLRTEDILEAIHKAGPALSVVLIGGIHYYTGQCHDLKAITEAAHRVGALAGFDLAHAVGNVPLHLHDWNVDFAVWCSYKYLNGGPGAAGALYIHERFSMDPQQQRFGGWSGSQLSTRFQMPRQFIPEPGADGWSLSVGAALVMAGLEASLALYEEVGMDRLRDKGVRLTAYLEYLMRQIPERCFTLITPGDPDARGAQLSLLFLEKGADIQLALADEGIVVDYREPGVIRVAPAPFYNSFRDVYTFYETVKNYLQA